MDVQWIRRCSQQKMIIMSILGGAHYFEWISSMHEGGGGGDNEHILGRLGHCGDIMD